MDSDHLSEDEEARIYSMLYYVDSANVTSESPADKTDKPVYPDSPDSTNTAPYLDDKINEEFSNNEKEQPSQNENSVLLTPNLPSDNQPSHSNNTGSEETRQTYVSIEYENNCGNEINSSNDRSRKKVCHSRRYWAEENDVSTMYFKVSHTAHKKSNNKLSKAVITLHNTRVTGKRKNSEGSNLPEENTTDMGSDENVVDVTSEQNKQMFATPVNTSTPKTKKQNKSKNKNNNKAIFNVTYSKKDFTNIVITPTPKGSKRVMKTPLTQRLLEKYPKKTQSNKYNVSRKTESIVIESSDDDSVVEVDLPDPKHTTIDLDSSDDSQTELTDDTVNKTSLDSSNLTKQIDGLRNTRGATSPVPSIVSSTSDDFIQADCSSLNITSGATSGPTFNFKLHGSEFSEAQYQNNEESETSITKSLSETITKKDVGVVSSTARLLDVGPEIFSYNKQDDSAEIDDNFATPISKTKSPKRKNYLVSEDSYVVPSADIFESESSDIPESVVDVPIITKKKQKKTNTKEVCADSTTDQVEVTKVMEMNPIMANVVGLDELNKSNQPDMNESPQECYDVVDVDISIDALKNFEFDKDTYYGTIYDKFFDHNKVRNEMPKDKELWKIDPADRLKPRRAVVQCGYCNRIGHRSETCYKKPSLCSMCGAIGHRSTRCPNKICLNCGSSSNSFSVDCKNCKSWKNIYCGTCRVHGHPTNKCPDIWRRYHLTVKNEVPLVEYKKRKSKSLHFCSGCAKRGHIINDCNNYIQFSNFKPPSPYIFHYTPVYTPDAVRNVSTSETSFADAVKRHTKDSESKNRSREPRLRSHDSLNDSNRSRAKSESEEINSHSKTRISENYGGNRSRESKTPSKGRDFDTSSRTLNENIESRSKNRNNENDSNNRKSPNTSKTQNVLEKTNENVESRSKNRSNENDSNDRKSPNTSKTQNVVEKTNENVQSRSKSLYKETISNNKNSENDNNNKKSPNTSKTQSLDEKTNEKNLNAISSSTSRDVVSSTESAPKQILVTVSNKVSSDNSEKREVQIIENAEPNLSRKSSDVMSNSNNYNSKSESVSDKNTTIQNTNVQKILEEHVESAGTTFSNQIITQAKQMDSSVSSLIMLSKQHTAKISTPYGKEILNELSHAYNLTTKITFYDKEAVLKITGNVEKHVNFQNDLQEKLIEPPKVIDVTPRQSIPKGRVETILKLDKDINSLREDLGNPKIILSKMNYLKKTLEQRKCNGKPKTKLFKNLTKELNKCYRSLNMIFMGQARLKEGNDASNKIDKMLKYLESQNFTSINDEMRDDIGLSYNTIFSSFPRNDYLELIGLYNKMKSKNNVVGRDILNKNRSPSWKNERSMNDQNARVVSNDYFKRKKTSLTNEDLLKLIQRTKRECYDLKNDPEIAGLRRFTKSFKNLKTMEARLEREYIHENEMILLRKTILRFDKYIVYCKKNLYK